MCVDKFLSKDVVIYRGKNAVIKFIMSIFKEYEYCKNVMKKHFNKNLVMTAEPNKEFERTNICWICGKLIDIGDNKVRDHDHIEQFNKYRGCAHWKCNVNLKITKKVPVILHNLRGYDSHLIFKELSKFNCRISVIPNGLEKYMSFSLNGNIVFIDSMLFLNSSLDKLVKDLSDEDFLYLSEEFSGEQLELVKEKGIYPYEYMNSFKKFKETKLPDIDCFFSEKDYQKTIKVWKKFKIKNLGEYHDLYLKADVLLLCDVFQKFIGVCLKDYCLDPCHHISLPGPSWDAMLQMIGIQLEKISDINVHLFLEKGIRGRISYISKRYRKFDQNTEIAYLDINNLYGYCMIQYLP